MAVFLVFDRGKQRASQKKATIRVDVHVFSLFFFVCYVLLNAIPELVYVQRLLYAMWSSFSHIMFGVVSFCLCSAWKLNKNKRANKFEIHMKSMFRVAKNISHILVCYSRISYIWPYIWLPLLFSCYVGGYVCIWVYFEYLCTCPHISVGRNS